MSKSSFDLECIVNRQVPLPKESYIKPNNVFPKTLLKVNNLCVKYCFFYFVVASRD